MSQSLNHSTGEGNSWESYETPKKSVEIGLEDSGYKSEQRKAVFAAEAVRQRHVPARHVRGGSGDFLQRHIHNITVMVILSSFCFGLFIGNMSKEESSLK